MFVKLTTDRLSTDINAAKPLRIYNLADDNLYDVFLSAGPKPMNGQGRSEDLVRTAVRIIQLYSGPVNRTVRLTGTSLLNSLTGHPVVWLTNFVYSVPVNRTIRLTGNCISPVNGKSG